jgi:hypothetical protein
MPTLLSPFLKGVSAKVLGISEHDDVGYVDIQTLEDPIRVEEQLYSNLRGERTER